MLIDSSKLFASPGGQSMLRAEMDRLVASVEAMEAADRRYAPERLRHLAARKGWVHIAKLCPDGHVSVEVSKPEEGLWGWTHEIGWTFFEGLVGHGADENEASYRLLDGLRIFGMDS